MCGFTGEHKPKQERMRALDGSSKSNSGGFACEPGLPKNSDRSWTDRLGTSASFASAVAPDLLLVRLNDMPSYEIFGRFYDAVMGDRSEAAERLSELIREAK